MQYPAFVKTRQCASVCYMHLGLRRHRTRSKRTRPNPRTLFLALDLRHHRSAADTAVVRDAVTGTGTTAALVQSRTAERCAPTPTRPRASWTTVRTPLPPWCIPLLLHPSPIFNIRTQQPGAPEHAQVSARVNVRRLLPRSVRDSSTISVVAPTNADAVCSNGLNGFEKSGICCEVRCVHPRVAFCGLTSGVVCFSQLPSKRSI